MKANHISVVLNNIKLPINASCSEAFSVARRIIGKIVANTSELSFSIFKRSVDARKKDDILFVYSVLVWGEFSPKEISRLSAIDASVFEYLEPQIVIGKSELVSPPVIVGTGPAGMFSALMLAEQGYDPILLERGGPVSDRISKVETFNKQHELDENTNIQFGAGGAGTFSDGKLVTRINDPLSNYVIDRLIEFGAPEEIRYLSKPHVGTDILSVIVEKILMRIEQLGGKVHYYTKFLGTKHRNGNIYAVETDRGDIPAGALILALGHSARDTYRNLLRDNLVIEPKQFSVGMRIEHLAEDIDRAMYGKNAGNPVLGHAEYNLSTNTKQRGVYTFCMCPGGEVVAAASQSLGVVVNGMSRHSRNGKNSNSAVVASVFKEDYGSTPELAIAFQEKIERAAFSAGGGNYSAPICTVGDFIDGTLKNEPKRVRPTYMNGDNVRLARPEEYLPSFVTDEIKKALSSFDRKISGFAAPDAVLTGAETRTSSPVRITRDQHTRLAIGYSNLYPAGEGAGYAGGITSAAIDGIKSALSLMAEYKPKRG